jgi:hypothetical protein
MAKFKVEEGIQSNGELILSASQIILSGSVVLPASAPVISSLNQFTGSMSIIAGPNITVNSGSGQIVITGSAGAVTTSLNGYSGSLQILAGPNITINSGSGFIMITGSAGGPGGGEVTGSDNFFVTNLLKASGTITNPIGHLILSSSAGSMVSVSSSIIIPRGGGVGTNGHGLGIGITSPWEAIHVSNGNVRIEGTNEYAFIVKRWDLTNSPQFSMGRVINAGDGDPEIRFVYQDDVTTERAVFEFDKKGIVASVKPTGSLRISL